MNLIVLKVQGNMAMSEVAGYCRALRSALCDEDPDLWNRDKAQSQIEDARNFLERLRENPPPPGDRIATIAWNDAVKLLQDMIDLVQDKLNGDTTFGVFVSNNPYMIVLNPYAIEKSHDMPPRASIAFV